MGRHAGNRCRSQGFRATDETWETFLTHLACKSAIEVSKLPGMPSAPAFIKKRKRDDTFNARAAAVLATRRPNNRGHIYSKEVWDSCLASIAKIGIERTGAKSDMPSVAGIYMRFWRDPQFRRRVIANRPSAKPVGETLGCSLRQNEIYAAAHAAAPRYLERADRDDIIADMVMAALEGQLLIAEMKDRAHEFVRQHRRLFGEQKTVSIDTQVFRNSKLTIGDRLAADAAP